MIKTNTIKTYNLTAMAMPFVLTFVVSPEQSETAPDLNAVTDQIKAFLNQVDQDFSAFKTSSLVSRYQRGELERNDWTDQFKEVYDQAISGADITDGAFNPYYSGKYDPTGMVKGWAIEKAFNAYLEPLIRGKQITGAVLNGAGDMKFGVMADSDFEWNIGIQDPADAARMIYQLDIQNGAVATSGIGEDGDHIQTVGLATTIQQATIISSDLVEADMLAIAAVAMGKEAFLTFNADYEANGLIVDNQLAEIEI